MVKPRDIEVEMSVCVHCGRTHGTDANSIAQHCAAVKAVHYCGYVYDGGCIVSHPGIDSIEYVDIESQIMLRKEVWLSNNDD